MLEYSRGLLRHLGGKKTECALGQFLVQECTATATFDSINFFRANLPIISDMTEKEVLRLNKSSHCFMSFHYLLLDPDKYDNYDDEEEEEAAAAPLTLILETNIYNRARLCTFVAIFIKPYGK